MVSIQQGNLRDQVHKGVSDLENEEGNFPLLNHVIETANIDPLLFFSASKDFFKGERTFWSNPSNTITLVGLGRAFEIDVDHSVDRFAEVEICWKNIIANMEPSTKYKYGTGPILFGGFSFDPMRERSNLWNDFSDATFVLPKILLTVNKDKCYLTYTGADSTELDKLVQMKEKIIQSIDNNEKDDQNNPFVKSEVSPERWMNSVKDVASDINNGELEKVVLAREVKLHFNDTPSTETVLSNLKEQQPMSYLFAFESGNTCFIGASPERLVKKKNNQIKSTCLAGSIARGKTLMQDEELANQLLNDPKNLIEHDVVVSMIKEAMTENCDEIFRPEQPQIFKMRDIQHLYTPIKGKAKDGVTLLSMVKKLHPTPALGGFPKDKALEKIREVELLDRGWYASPIGWVDVQDNGEFAVAIRSGLLKGNEASLFAGCGIVADSEPESEYNETNIKFKPMLSALGGENNE